MCAACEHMALVRALRASGRWPTFAEPAPPESPSESAPEPETDAGPANEPEPPAESSR